MPRTLDDCPDLAPWAAETTNFGADPHWLRAQLLDAIREGVDAHPRSAQTEIGPSEIGHRCPRWIASVTSSNVPSPRLRNRPWRSGVPGVS